MIEAKGNLWDFPGIKVITTNGFVKKDGTAVMGRGCAREAALKYPELPMYLGKRILHRGNHVNFFNYDEGLITFPVKYIWWEKADIQLIQRSAEELVAGLNEYYFITHKLIIPRPGCGNGGLDWETEVKPVIRPILSSDQYIVVTNL